MKYGLATHFMSFSMNLGDCLRNAASLAVLHFLAFYNLYLCILVLASYCLIPLSLHMSNQRLEFIELIETASFTSVLPTWVFNGSPCKGDRAGKGSESPHGQRSSLSADKTNCHLRSLRFICWYWLSHCATLQQKSSFLQPLTMAQLQIV